MSVRVDSSQAALSVAVGSIAAGFGLLAGINPQLAIGGALALAFLLVVLADLSLGLVLFTLLAFVDLLPATSGPALSFAKAAGVMLAISWLATLASSDRTKGEDLLTAHPGICFLLLAFLGWTAISAVWAESAGAAFTSVYRYALNALLFLIIYTAVRTRRDAFRVAGAYVVAATLSAAYGLVLQPAVPDSGIYASADLNRVAGTIGDPNLLASVLVPAIVLAVALGFAARRSPGRRLAAWVAAGFLLVTVFLTLSRGGLLALGGALVAGVLIGGRWRTRVGLVALAAVLSTVVWFVAVASPQSRDRVSKSDGGTGRTDIWKVGWRMVQARPVLGVGAGNFEISSIHYLLKPGPLRRDEFIVDEPKVAHNIYLQILAEEGIPGLALFMAIVGAALACAARAAREAARRGDQVVEALARAVLVGTIGVLVADFFLSAEFAKQLWLLLGLGPTLLALARRDDPRKEPRVA